MPVPDWESWFLGTDQNKKSVSMTEAQAKFLVAEVIDGVKRAQDADLRDQYRLLARQEAELAEARREATRRDSEIAALRAYINTLITFVTSLTPTPGIATLPIPPMSTVSLPPLGLPGESDK